MGCLSNCNRRNPPRRLLQHCTLLRFDPDSYALSYTATSAPSPMQSHLLSPDPLAGRS
jgi:hypothetical protein